MASTIHPEIKKITDSFIDQLKAAYGDGLISVIIYGSSASGEFSRRHSNINIAVILKDASLRNLTRSSRALGQYKFRLLDPVFFTEGYLKTSADVFPI
jgi:predicted nucleotidyltransferase